jgi:hypothetical protein
MGFTVKTPAISLWRIKTEDNISHSILLRSLGVSISMADIYEGIVFPEKKKKK